MVQLQKSSSCQPEPHQTHCSYDVSRGLSRLAEGWVSQAAAHQRRGRAGRVRPGICFRLVSRQQWASLAPQQAPEVLRVPLEALVLQVAALREAASEAQSSSVQGSCTSVAAAAAAAPLPGAGRLAEALAALPTPPDEGTVLAAVARLLSLGALRSGGGTALAATASIGAGSVGEALTGLGRHLVAMPLDPRLGKALLYAALLR